MPIFKVSQKLDHSLCMSVLNEQNSSDFVQNCQRPTQIPELTKKKLYLPICMHAYFNNSL